jgi:hypothetical protein
VCAAMCTEKNSATSREPGRRLAVGRITIPAKPTMESRQRSFHVPEAFTMKLTHKFEELAQERRPQDPHLDGTGLRFETMEHGGEYPDAMPQAIKVIDAEGRSCIYVPISQDGKVVDTQRFAFDLEDD